MPTEVEAKFRAESAGPLLGLASRTGLGHARLGVARTVDEVDRYLDTDEGHLAAARWACRLRTREGATRISLKGPPVDSAEAWYHRRPEVEGPATEAIDPDGWPRSPALDLLDRLRAGQPLAEHLRLDQVRTERAVRLADGTSIGTLTLDRVRMRGGGSELGELFVVELELDAASASAAGQLTELAAELAATEGLVPEPRSKLERALDRVATRR
ncbi:MAG TPA: CYTH domain-containing protein [Candidatus Limnocylindria bacterium]